MRIEDQEVSKSECFLLDLSFKRMENWMVISTIDIIWIDEVEVHWVSCATDVYH